MFTSRAEYRLILREDNADLRLTEKGRELGLVDDERWAAFEAKREGIVQEEQRLKSTWVRPGTPQGDAIAARFGVTSIPLVVGFQNGEKVVESVGAKPKAALEKEFSALLG